MEELDRALADITAIRSQLARGTEFRGDGPMTVAATGFVAVGAAGIQALWLPDPAGDLFDYVAIWVATAAVSILLIGIEMVARSRRIHSGLADAMIHAATEQFIPAGVAGALLTFVLFRFAPQCLWMLPGLWQIIFSLGLFWLAAAPDLRRCGVVPRHRADRARACKRGAGFFPLRHGAPLRHRAAPDCRH